MGKTLVMIAAHALEQHTLPEKPVMHTEWTDAELREYEEVLVGKDIDTAKQQQMFKGFKQLDDDKGTIVPDGSVWPLTLSCMLLLLHVLFVGVVLLGFAPFSTFSGERRLGFVDVRCRLHALLWCVGFDTGAAAS